MLDDTMQSQLAAYLERLRRPIQLTVVGDETDSSAQMRGLVADIVKASNKVSVVTSDDALPRRPSFAISATGEAPRVTFSGLPMGHEFTSLVLALLHVG